MMSGLHITLFGRFAISHNDVPLTGLETRKVQELLCYLLLYRDRQHPRELLASVLWADCTAKQAKKYIRQALWQLQTALKCQDTPEESRLLLVDADFIGVNPAADYMLDVALLEGAYRQVRNAPGYALDGDTIDRLRRAIDGYRADLLEGWYHDWCLYERERLRAIYLMLLDKLMSHCEASGEFDSGVIYGNLALRHDRAHERTHRRLMRLYHLAGDRTAALRQYERCCVALDQELGVEPTERTHHLHHQIRAGHLEIDIAEQDATLPRMLAYLDQLRAMLDDVQSHVSMIYGIQTPGDADTHAN